MSNDKPTLSLPNKDAKEPVKLFPVRLLKNYRPAGEYEIVGYQRPEEKRKDAIGRMVVVQEAAFIEGEMAPAPYPGVGFDTKIWAETVLKLPIDEAKNLVSKNLATRADAIPG